jgi:ATP-dependent exoDNAse (exonuclease V) beta subunit
MYWNKKNKNDTFIRYAIFHKSEEGSSIQLSESEEATRLVSIHTSKGDGRNVVFVIGLTEQ